MSETGKPWRDEELLRKKYVEEELTTTEIAEDLGCAQPTISTWLDKHDIETRRSGPNQKPSSNEWRKESVLRELYHEKGYSMPQIADELGCGEKAVRRWMDRHDIDRRENTYRSISEKYPSKERFQELYHDKGLSCTEIGEELGINRNTVLSCLHEYGIETRDRAEASARARKKKPVGHRINEYGYEVWDHNGIEAHRTLPVHRLLAVCEYGVDEVADSVVHHKNGVRWDNRPKNIEVMSRSEHAKHHSEVSGGVPFK